MRAREDGARIASMVGAKAAKGFEGKVAIVTGGASGIGAALGRALGEEGADVVLADRQVALAEEVAAAIRAAGGQARSAELDVRQLASMARVVDDTQARAGRIDLFFNNAGIGVGGEMSAYAPRDWDDVFDVNLRGVAYGVQCVYPRMIRQGSGHIVNTASVAGLIASPLSGSYCAAKHAVVGLSKSLRVEAKRHGVRVSALCPGAIATPILSGGKFGRMNMGVTGDVIERLWARAHPMNPDVFAHKVLKAVARNEAIIIVPAWWKALWYLERLSPSLGLRLAESVLERTRAELASAEKAHPASATGGDKEGARAITS
jgi:NAD(P)-dependent dehydrogenase (short-subunit alcohol dehydrogenase family)